MKLIVGDALLGLDRIAPKSVDLIVTDPPYAFGGSGQEHALTATVSVVLREAADRLKTGGWLIVYAASSWRSQAYMVESVRGKLEPVRTATWVKPSSTSKTKTPGWKWSTVSLVAFRKGKSAPIDPCEIPDFIVAPTIGRGRRAQLPSEVAQWSIEPFAVQGGGFLDPFCGSGSLPKAAEVLGMHAVGIEKDPLGSLLEDPCVEVEYIQGGESPRGEHEKIPE